MMIKRVGIKNGEILNPSVAVQNSGIECPKLVMQRVDHAGILARGLFAWLLSKAQ
jgi:hypothetical protein